MYVLTTSGEYQRADTVAGIIDHARRILIDRAGAQPVELVITTPEGTPYPIRQTIPDTENSDRVIADVDDLLWDLRATLHYDADRRSTL